MVIDCTLRWPLPSSVITAVAVAPEPVPARSRIVIAGAARYDSPVWTTVTAVITPPVAVAVAVAFWSHWGTKAGSVAAT